MSSSSKGLRDTVYNYRWWFAALVATAGILGIGASLQRARQADGSAALSRMVHEYDSKECARLLEEQQQQDDAALTQQRAELAAGQKNVDLSTHEARAAKKKVHDYKIRINRCEELTNGKDIQIKALQERLSLCVVDNKHMQQGTNESLTLVDELMQKVNDQESKLARADGIERTFGFLADEYKESQKQAMKARGPYTDIEDEETRKAAVEEHKADVILERERADNEHRALEQKADRLGKGRRHQRKLLLRGAGAGTGAGADCGKSAEELRALDSDVREAMNMLSDALAVVKRGVSAAGAVEHIERAQQRMQAVSATISHAQQR